jgi:hypothetical protein
VSGLADIRKLAPFTVRGYEGTPAARTLQARLGIRTGEEARLSLALDAADPPRITALALFTQAPCRLPS